MAETALRTRDHPKIITYAPDGAPNGYLVPIYNVHDRLPGGESDGAEPQQVYCTAIAPHAIKGPHLHHVRTGRFTCLHGNVRLVVKTPAGYDEYFSGQDHDYLTVEVPPGVAVALQNLGGSDALVLNMPSPAWHPDMHDEHTADFGDFDFGTPQGAGWPLREESPNP